MKKKISEAINCIGNLSDFVDAFLIWIEEMIDTGDYRPGAEIRKASREEIGNFVRRTRCNVRVVQEILDAARHYEKLDSGISQEGLAELHNEVWSLYRSAEDLVAADHPGPEYLSGHILDILARATVEIEQDFRLNIIPPNQEVSNSSTALRGSGPFASRRGIRSKQERTNG